MTIRARWALPLLSATLLAFPAPSCAQATPTLAITQVTVIEPDDAPQPSRAGQTVLVRGDRIIAVGRDLAIPAGSRIVDGAGKFLIPGLWDMHVHTTVPRGRDVLALYVANGVTGVRDMAGEWATLKAWRAEIAAGLLVGPRIIASGPYLEGGAMPIPHILTRTPAEAVTSVDSLVAMGVDFIKLHGQLNRDTYFASARRARERGIPFAGHVPRAVGAAAASDSGIASIEHLLGLTMPCTAAESLAWTPRFAVQGAIGRCGSEDQAGLAARFVRNGTWLTPTFVAAYEIAEWPRRVLPGLASARYLPNELRDFVEGIFPVPDSIPPGAEMVGRAVLARRLEQVATMHRAGVRVLAGTDAPLRNSPPGFGLHEELALLVRAGLTPREALRTATSGPAEFLKLQATSGRIAVGMRADLVLLDGDPLHDIANTRRIRAVIAGGRLHDRTALDRLLALPSAGTVR